MGNFIDFGSYDLHGYELLAASAIGGLYAMMITGNYCGSQEDFKNLTSRDDHTHINADAVRQILTEAFEQMDKAMDGAAP